MTDLTILLEINRKLDLLLGYPEKDKDESKKDKQHRENVAILYKPKLKQFKKKQ